MWTVPQRLFTVATCTARWHRPSSCSTTLHRHPYLGPVVPEHDDHLLGQIACDVVGYLPPAELGAEFVFLVIADRAEQAAVLLTTNLRFSEWTQVIPNAGLCQGAVGLHH